MAKKKRTTSHVPEVDVLSFIHQPHDKYAKNILQVRAIALQVMQFAIREEVLKFLDMESFELSNASFIDEQLKDSLADICYEGRTNTGEPFVVNILYEHKSEKPDKYLYEQLNRYLANKWAEDRRQSKPLSLSVTVLLYHGREAIQKYSLPDLFQGAPDVLLQYVPAFDYILLDISHLPDNQIEQLEFLALRNVFLAFKYGRNENYLVDNWKKVIIFAKEISQDPSFRSVVKSTILYMVHVSRTVNSKIKSPEQHFDAGELDILVDLIPECFRDTFKQGMEQGVKQGIEQGVGQGVRLMQEKVLRNYLMLYPHATDEMLSDLLEISIEDVRIFRAGNNKF